MSAARIPHAGRDWTTLAPEQVEENRHAHEVEWCHAKGYDWCVAYCAGVADEKRGRGRAAAERLWNDIRARSLQDRRAA